MRDHDASHLTDRELNQARRELAASLALSRPDSPIRAPIQTQLTAIEAELADRAHDTTKRTPTGTGEPQPPQQ